VAYEQRLNPSELVEQWLWQEAHKGTPEQWSSEAMLLGSIKLFVNPREEHRNSGV
jgi:hypothetical protein